MKRFISVLVCLIFLCSAALSAAASPEMQQTQEEMRRGFLTNLGRFVLGTNLQKKALQLDVRQMGEPAGGMILQQTGDYLDLEGAFGPVPVRAQLTGEGLLVSVDGKTYAVPFENMQQILFGLMSGGTVLAPQNPMDFCGILLETLIKPGFTMETREKGFRLRLDVDGDRLIALGDALMDSDAFRSLYAMVFGQNPLREWQSVRSVLGSRETPVRLQADLQKEEDAYTLDILLSLPEGEAVFRGKADQAAAEFTLEVRDVLNLRGNADLGAGSFACHGESADGMTMDLTLTPMEAGRVLKLDIAQEQNVFDLQVTENADTVDAAFRLSAGEEEGQSVDGEFRVDKAAGTVTGRMKRLDEAVLRLSGRPEENGYHMDMTYAMDEEVFGSWTMDMRSTRELLEAEFRANAMERTMILTASYAPETGALRVRMDGPDGNYLDGRGVVKKNAVDFVITEGRDGREYGTVAVICEGSEDTGRISVTVDEKTISGNVERTLAADAEWNIGNGIFSGSFWMPRERTRYRLEAVKQKDSLMIRAFSNRDGSLELNLAGGENHLSGDVRISAPGMNMTGSALLTPQAETVSLTMPTYRFNGSLIRNAAGQPVSLDMTYQGNGGRDLFELRASGSSLYVSRDRNVVTVNGYFADDQHLILDVRQYENGRTQTGRTRVTLTAQPDCLALRGEGETELFALELGRTERREIESLQGREDIIEMTPELAYRLLSERMENVQ